MPNDIGILQEMIKDSAKIPDKKQVTLIESKDPKNRKVTISGLPDDAIVIKADEFTPLDTVFECSKGECKCADFIIVANTGKKRVIIYIEMKAAKESEKQIIQQLNGARCFMSYCREIGKSFWQSRDFLTRYQERFVKIIPASIPKKPTRPSEQMGDHDKPDKMLKINTTKNGRLAFNQLAGKPR
uniref:Uncharacterized protein n=1 Tax=Candidatus Kentrum sp. FW TaxID=2126338 RepID=A0A450U285_9GAMM|nr:MAG: hypothetical protein BECKFW1821C_GA0114237_11145 [Candidatus Kentron sp. FW]